jgi:molybdate/tungstate transport system permease protein
VDGYVIPMRLPLPSNRGSGWPWFELVLAMLGSGVVLLVVAPLIGLFVASSFLEVSQAIAEREVVDSIRLTLLAALAAAAVCCLGGIPLAWLLARKRFFGRSLLMAVLDLPIVIPHSAAGIALLTLIGRHSLVGSLTGGGLVGTTAGISVAMAFVSIPFLVNVAREAFAAVPERLERAARTLGASSSRVFFTISLPMAWRGVLAGAILMWARGISEFGAVIIITYHPITTPVLVFQRFNDYGLPYARAASVVLILICMVFFIALRLLLVGRRGEDDRA